MNLYGYANQDSLRFSDSDGLNPALATYRAGTAGYKVGEVLNPYLQPPLASALDALLIPDPLADANAVLAQNNKQIRKRIEGLQAQVDEHKRKLNREPDCDPANHWRQESRLGSPKSAAFAAAYPMEAELGR